MAGSAFIFNISCSAVPFLKPVRKLDTGRACEKQEFFVIRVVPGPFASAPQRLEVRSIKTAHYTLYLFQLSEGNKVHLHAGLHLRTPVRMLDSDGLHRTPGIGGSSAR